MKYVASETQCSNIITKILHKFRQIDVLLRTWKIFREDDYPYLYELGNIIYFITSISRNSY